MDARSVHGEGIKTPLHPAVLEERHKAECIERMRVHNIGQRKVKFKRRVDLAWNAALTACTVNIVTHHPIHWSGWLYALIALAVARILLYSARL